MPNHTFNTITAAPEIIARILNEKGEIDFNKFIPMPEELRHTTSGSIVDELMALYILNTYSFKEFEKQCNAHGVGYVGCYICKTKKETKTKLEERLGGRTEDVIRENWADKNSKVIAVLTGEDYCKLHEKYGCHDWYSWANKYWNTKWNAYDQSHDDENIWFSTAWSCPEPILNMICHMFPTDEIEFSSEYEEGYLTKASNHKGTYMVDGEYELICGEDENGDSDWDNAYWFNEETQEKIAY